MSKLITNTIRHTGGSADNITLDNSQNVTVEGNAIVDGNVGVGTTSPSGASGKVLEVHGGSGQARFALKNDTTGSGSTDGHQIYSDGNTFGIQNREAGAIKFETNGAERLQIKSDGTIQTNGALDIKIADGNLIMGTAGHGIDFAINSHAGGMTSELLDHYEEGTYTPEIWASGSSSGLSITYTTQVGHYTKVGNVVQFSATIDYSAKSGAESNSTAYITISLPFTTKSNSWGNTSMQFNTAIEFDEGSNNVHHNGGNAYTYFWSGLDAGRQDYYPRTSNLHSSGGIYIAGTYLT